jgi:hypothetical protein
VSGATPATFPPTIFAGTASVFEFHVSPSPPLGIFEGGLSINFLGQAERQETKMDDIGGLRLKQV